MRGGFSSRRVAYGRASRSFAYQGHDTSDLMKCDRCRKRMKAHGREVCATCLRSIEARINHMVKGEQR